jgi:hypothetical protein
MRRVLLVFALGCARSEGDSALEEPGVEVTLTDFQYRSCWDDVSGSERVVASHSGEGAIAVLHEIEYQDCMQIQASAQADEARLVVDYEVAEDGECSEICWFRIDFMLTGIPAGTWTVEIEDAPTSAVIVP